MLRVAVIDDCAGVAELLVARLRESPIVENCQRVARCDMEHIADYALRFQGVDTVVYSPLFVSGKHAIPDIPDAATVFQVCTRVRTIKKFILLSSAAVYGASPQNPGLMTEDRLLPRNSKNEIAAKWAELERVAAERLGDQGIELTVLRNMPVLRPDGKDYFSRLLQKPLAVTLPGHDPSIQLLSAEDLAEAVRCALEQSAAGIYNVAPDGVIPLRRALRIRGSRRVPIPRTLQRLARALLKPIGLAHSAAQLDYVRYSWTVSNKKIRRELGFVPKRSSAQTVAEFTAAQFGRQVAIANDAFDDFGFDRSYLQALGRTLFNFLERYYWRVEITGVENLPREGRVVLVGLHRGFMPWDGIIAIHQVLKLTGRCPRFLMHPGLVKPPFIANFMTKIGGVIACQENADHILERGEILGIFPEGVKAAFTPYRDAYRLGKFGRNDFVKIALRHQAAIVPFVTIGSAEIFPILKRIEWSWWKRHTDWPCLPLTFTPLPLPSKWHTQFLNPIQLRGVYPPEAAEDPATVRAVSHEVRVEMEKAIEKILSSRKSIFYGSVFEPEAS